MPSFQPGLFSFLREEDRERPDRDIPRHAKDDEHDEEAVHKTLVRRPHLQALASCGYQDEREEHPAKDRRPDGQQKVEIKCADDVAVEERVKAPRQSAARAGKPGEGVQRAYREEAGRGRLKRRDDARGPGHSGGTGSGRGPR